MLITRTNPAGIDFYIQKLQTEIHDRLVGASGTAGLLELATDAYNSYGRCYRNKKDRGYVAEVYTGSNEYREVYWNDTLAMISFFGISGTVRKAGPMSEADVHLVFFANLSTLALKDRTAAAITHRADEELRQKVVGIIGKYSNGFTYLSTELWLENVLREYPGNYRDEGLRVVDMHPIHCFRINLKLVFDQNKNC